MEKARTSSVTPALHGEKPARDNGNGISLSENPQSRPALSAVPRVLVLCAGDPQNTRTFSGSAGALVRALQRRGAHYHSSTVLGITDAFRTGPPLLEAVRRLDRFGLEERYRWSNLCLQRNSERAAAVMSAFPDFDAVLMYGTTFLPPTGVPTYCYFDATFAQVHGAGAWSFSALGANAAARIGSYQKRIYNQCKAIFPRTRWAAESVHRDYGITWDKIAPAGAGPNHVAEPLPHESYDQCRILFIGTEFERKGGPLILEAFRRLRQTMPDATLVIVGCKPAISEPGVEVVGPIHKSEAGGTDALLRWYSRASIFCIMSNFEPFGIVVLEAQHSGVPCVAPNAFAFPETIVDQVTGRLAPPGDPDALSQIWLELLSEPARLKAMGVAAHDHVLANWTWDRAAERICDRIAQDLAGEASSA